MGSSDDETYVSNWKRALDRFSTPQALTKSKLRGSAEARGIVSEAWVAIVTESTEQVTVEASARAVGGSRESAEAVAVSAA